MAQWVICMLYEDQISHLYHPRKRVCGYVPMASVLRRQRDEDPQGLVAGLAELVNSIFYGGGLLLKQ